MHLPLARLSSALYLIGLTWVAAILCCFAASLLLPPAGMWLERSGTLQYLLNGLLYVCPPVLALSLLCGVVARCPGCGRRYARIVWLAVGSP